MPPPELAGREYLLDRVRITLERVRLGRPAKSILVVGLRGVGKTVLLLGSSDYAESRGMLVTRVEAPESRSLPALLAPGLRTAMIKLAGRPRARELARRALRGLAGFAGALKVKYHDIELGLDLDPEPGLADNGESCRMTAGGREARVVVASLLRDQKAHTSLTTGVPTRLRRRNRCTKSRPSSSEESP